jgi:2-C-methyl-D-erythritol 4-phosphate cytidylyltransferase
MEQLHVVIVAGGGGSRMQAEIPKQFLPLAGKPMLIRTLERFSAALPLAKIIIVLPEAHILRWKELLNKSACRIEHLIVPGGSTRFESVKNGLQYASGGFTAIHDGVRPFPSDDLIRRCFAEAAQYGSAIPVIEVTDTIRLLENTGSSIIDRSMLRGCQTPQCFTTELIKSAYLNAAGESFTDCASVLEAQGQQVHLIRGETANIKITVPADLDYANWLLLQKGEITENLTG